MIAVTITRKRALGFSLIEVVLSLGVTGFAFVALLGLLPVGLKTFRSAMETSVQAQIAQQVSAEVQQARFSELTNSSSYLTNFPKYYDDQGAIVSSSADPTRIYTVRTTGVVGKTLPGAHNTTSPLWVFRFSVQARNSPAVTNFFSVVVTDKGI